MIVENYSFTNENGNQIIAFVREEAYFMIIFEKENLKETDEYYIEKDDQINGGYNGIERVVYRDNI